MHCLKDVRRHTLQMDSSLTKVISLQTDSPNANAVYSSDRALPSTLLPAWSTGEITNVQSAIFLCHTWHIRLKLPNRVWHCSIIHKQVFQLTADISKVFNCLFSSNKTVQKIFHLTLKRDWNFHLICISSNESTFHVNVKVNVLFTHGVTQRIIFLQLSER